MFDLIYLSFLTAINTVRLFEKIYITTYDFDQKKQTTYNISMTYFQLLFFHKFSKQRLTWVY